MESGNDGTCPAELEDASTAFVEVLKPDGCSVMEVRMEHIPVTVVKMFERACSAKFTLSCCITYIHTIPHRI